MLYRSLIEFSLILNIFASLLSLNAAEIKSPQLILLDDFPPYHFDRGNGPEGVLVHKLKQILDQNSFPFEINIVPWNRAFLKSKLKNNIVGPMARTKEREEHYKWLYKYHTLKNNFISCNKDLFINEIGDLFKYRIGSQINDFRINYLLSHRLADPRKVHYVRDMRLNLMLCLKKRIDIFMIGEWLLENILEEQKLAKERFFKVFDIEEFNLDLYLVMNRKSDSKLEDDLKYYLRIDDSNL